MKPTQKKPITAFTVISTIILLLLTILFIFPFYWILTGAFKSQPDVYDLVLSWLCLGEETLLWATNSLCYLHCRYGPSKTSCLSPIGTDYQLYGNPRYPSSGYLATGWMALRCLLDEAI